MEIVSKTILLQIITQCTGTQDIIKKLASCGPGGRKSGFKSVAFLLRLSILNFAYQCLLLITFTNSLGRDSNTVYWVRGQDQGLQNVGFNMWLIKFHAQKVLTSHPCFQLLEIKYTSIFL